MTTELIVRALIVKNRRILVCNTHGRDYYFLPGGHVEFGETMRSALVREIYEEIGARVTAAQYIGSVEGVFLQEDKQKHEVSFVYNVDIDSEHIVSKESHITFYWFPMKDFIEKNVVPSTMKDAILKWSADKETFFIEEKSK